jgi:hypothetical protein
MSIVIQLVNGSPKKRKGEKMAGVILTRDPKLGFRMKVQALPGGREIHRLVSDCPLAITEQTLLWLQRHKWQWKLHPNSLDVQELLKQVKTYTNLLPAEHIGDACDLLLENFRANGNPAAVTPNKAKQKTAQQPLPPRPTPVAGPSQEEMMQQMAIMQAQMMAMQQQMTGGQQPAPAPGMNPLEAKMARTQQRTAEHLAQVNATVEAKARREEMQQQVLDNLDEIVEEVDEIVGENVIVDEPVIQDEELESESGDYIETPEMFDSPQEAWAWAVELGVFDEEEAETEYNELKKAEKPKNAKQMATLWTSTCIEIYEMMNEE